MRQFMVGGLVGLPIGVDVTHGLNNLINARPFGEMSDASLASIAFIGVGGVALLMAKYLPDWFAVIEPEPPSPPEVKP